MKQNAPYLENEPFSYCSRETSKSSRELFRKENPVVSLSNPFSIRPPTGGLTRRIRLLFKDLEKLLIALFCFALPLGTRTVLRSVDERFFPYGTAFLYAIDILMLALVGLWAFRLAWKRVFIWLQSPLFLSVVAFLVIGAISSLRSNSPVLGVITVAKFALWAVFAALLARSLKTLPPLFLVVPVFVSGVAQSLIAWAQFMLQKDLGMRLLGEQMLRADLAGVAKLEVAGEKLIRAYGTFPHPNILAAFLVLALAVSVWWYLKSSLRGARLNFAEQNLGGLGGIALMLSALLFTFSRSGWIAGSIVGIGLCGWLVVRHRAVSTEIKKRAVALAIVLGFVMLFSGFYFREEVGNRKALALQDQSVQLRLQGAFWAAKMIDQHKLIGIGPGQFVQNIDRYVGKLPEAWMYQPVHNLYLLIAAEYGLLGLIAFLFFIGFVVRQSVRGLLQNDAFFSMTALLAFVAFLFLGLFDHFLITYEQGTALFWLVVALMLGVRNPKHEIRNKSE